MALYPEETSSYTYDQRQLLTEATLTNGNIVKIWTSADPASDGDGSAVLAQLFDAAGAAIGDAFVVNTTGAGDQDGATVAVLDDGGFVIGWNSYLQIDPVPPSDYPLFFKHDSAFLTQTFSSAGQKVGNETRIYDNSGIYDDYQRVSGHVSNLANGDVLIDTFVIQPGEGRVDSFFTQAQILNADGGVITPLVTTGVGANSFTIDDHDVAHLTNGGFVAVSGDSYTDELNEQWVRVKIYATDGTQVGQEIDIATGVYDDPVHPRVTALNDGTFVVRWDGGVQLFDSTGQMLDILQHPVSADNHAPVMTTNDGDPIDIYVDETTASFDLHLPLTATDADGDTIHYALAGGPDASAIFWGAQYESPQVGPFDFENPADANGDNIYEFYVRAIDESFSAYDEQLVRVHVLDDPYDNVAPIIRSNGGGDSAAIALDENLTAVTTIIAEGTSNFSLSGADASRFTISGAGALTFRSAPDFEHASDADRDNVYDVTVRATTAGGLFDEQTLHITVLDADEPMSIYGTGNADSFTGGAYADTFYGGKGNDVYHVDGTDAVVEIAGGGAHDRMTSAIAGFTLAAYVEDGELTGGLDLSITGNERNNSLIGNDGANSLYGGNGRDELNGGRGADSLTGGAGKDQFTLDETVLADGLALVDTITDFSSIEDDRIDLHLIDAKAGKSGNQAFTFIGGGAFGHVEGQLRFAASGEDGMLSGDVDGDGLADFQILLLGVDTLTKGDLIL